MSNFEALTHGFGDFFPPNLWSPFVKRNMKNFHTALYLFIMRQVQKVSPSKDSILAINKINQILLKIDKSILTMKK